MPSKSNQPLQPFDLHSHTRAVQYDTLVDQMIAAHANTSKLLTHDHRNVLSQEMNDVFQAIQKLKAKTALLKLRRGKF